MTAQEHAVGIRLADWETGGLDESSCALTWRRQMIPHDATVRGIGELAADVVDAVARAVESVLQT